MASFFALRVVRGTDVSWPPGSYVRFTRASDQEPALGFGNFDTFDRAELAEASLRTTRAGAKDLEDLFLRHYGRANIKVEIVEFREAWR